MYFPPEDWDEEEDPPTPTVEIQLEGITHDPNSSGKTKSSYIPLMQIDVATGDVKNANFGSKVGGVAGIIPGEWNTGEARARGRG
jgi:predicted urease superfamily metal-dependent hydrolase